MADRCQSPARDQCPSSSPVNPKRKRADTFARKQGLTSVADRLQSLRDPTRISHISHVCGSARFRRLRCPHKSALETRAAANWPTGLAVYVTAVVSTGFLQKLISSHTETNMRNRIAAHNVTKLLAIPPFRDGEQFELLVTILDLPRERIAVQSRSAPVCTLSSDRSI